MESGENPELSRSGIQIRIPTQPIVRKHGEGGDKVKLGARILALPLLVTRAQIYFGKRGHGPPRKGIDGRRYGVSAPGPLFVKILNTEEKIMKLSQSRQGFLLAAIAGICLLPSISNAANIIVGTGNDTSYLVLQSTNLGVRTYVVHYTYNAGSPQDGYFLLDTVLTSDPSLHASVGLPGNRFLSRMEYNSVIEEYDGTNYWAQWVSGGLGYQGPPPDYNFDPGIPALGEWTEGYGISTHTIAPGSWDALFFSDGLSKPSVAPVPETSSAVFVVLGSLVIFKRRRIS